MNNTFSELGLSAQILRTISRHGYEKPTPIQARAIPLALQGRDLLLSAQTGSGKTAAFVLPILQQLAAEPTKSKLPRALIVIPTRELAQQVQDSVFQYSREFKELYSVTLVGGTAYQKQIRALKKGVSIVVATPGRLLDHVREGHLDLSQIRYLVLDEADRMLDMGFSDDMHAIIKQCPQNRQTIMSSATWDGNVGKIAAGFTHNAEKIIIAPETSHIEEISYFTDDQAHKNAVLDRLLADEAVTQCIVFTATKSTTETVAHHLYENGFQAQFLHGDLQQQKRNRIIERFRNGQINVLVATDIAARGIDIPAISHVINYDLPRQSEDYVHRIGRSGRAGRSGVALNLVSLTDRAAMAHIERYLKRAIKTDVLEGLEPTKVPSKKKPSSGRGKTWQARGAKNGSRANSEAKSARGNWHDRKTGKITVARKRSRAEGKSFAHRAS